MPDLDLVIRNGTVVTAADRFGCDVGVSGGRIVALAEGLPRAAHEIDAAGRLVLPGGVDSHCHIEQLSGMGIWNADDFYSGTVAAAFGGTTTVIPFAAQHHGQSMREVVADYRERAKKAVVDHAFHMIVSDPTETVLSEELPALIRDGYSSLKLFMTYPLLRLDDAQMLDLLASPGASGRWSRCTPRTTRCSPGPRAACSSAAIARRNSTRSAIRASPRPRR